MMRAILMGILSSFFFAFTFVLNRLMSDDGGSWMWSASLRYLFMVPLLILVVAVRKNLKGLFAEICRHPWQWVLWSLIGFGLFYAPLCFSADYSPAWLVAGTWQFTIIAGSLVVPFFHETLHTADGTVRVRKRLPYKGMGMSLIILFGIGLMEWSQSTHVSTRNLLLGILPVMIATFAYPLGNRKMMELCEGRLDAYQRTLGMTLASLPLWLLLSLIGVSMNGFPSANQAVQSLIVAVFSGVVATVLFFSATDWARGNVHRLAAVEATQAGEVVFALVGELLLVSGTKVSLPALVGLGFVVIGMVLHSLSSMRVRCHSNSSNMESVQVKSVTDA